MDNTRFEERVLNFNGFKVRLCYRGNGEIDGLYFEHGDGTRIVVRSKSIPIAPEKIYELLRECEITW